MFIYSRLGLTNIWIRCLFLMALGLINLAWQATEGQRNIWLRVGLAVGFSAYFYTSAHLLPIILLLLFVYALLFERTTLWQQRSHLLAAIALALVIALPQLQYYNNIPGIFMERIDLLGVLDQHSGWLNQEALRTGQTPVAVWWQQVQKAALAFNGTWDTSTLYKPQAPLLSFIPAILLVWGVFLSLLHLRRLANATLLIWLGATIIFAGALIQDPPASHRLIIVAPALALLVAIA